MGINDVSSRYNQLVSKLLGMTSGAPIPKVAPELMSTLALEVDRPEWATLKGERLLSARYEDAADPANRSHVGIYHPGTEGLLCVIEKIIMDNNTGGTVIGYIRMDAGPLTWDSTGGRYSRDNFLTTDTFAGACTIGAKTGGGLGAVLARFVVPNVNNFIWDMPIVLRKQGAVFVSADGVNTQVSATFVYRERYLEPSETR